MSEINAASTDNNNNTTTTNSKKKNDEDTVPQVMKDVTDPQDSDVLCGRGGAALRHPGNQTYRRLVNLNKGLYITCLKTEKLKISRSIVAAIREQQGRFLEKNGDKGSWCDIGDKKAIEKTSQALREGQPKLRQKIVDMGGGSQGTAALMESQFGPAGQHFLQANSSLYQTDPAVMGVTPSSSMSVGNMSQMSGSLDGSLQIQLQQQHMQQQQLQQHQQMQQQQQPNINEYSHEMLLQRLSLHEQSDDSRSWQQQQQQRNSSRLRPGVHPRDLGMSDQSQMSLLSGFSDLTASMGGMPSSSSMPNESLLSMDSSFRRALQGLGSTNGGGNNNNNNNNGVSQYSNHSTHSQFAPSVASVDSNNMHINNSFHSNVNGMGVTSNVGGGGAGSMHTFASAHTNQSATSAAGNNLVNQQNSNGNLDRRRVFAKMKYTRPELEQTNDLGDQYQQQQQQQQQHSYHQSPQQQQEPQRLHQQQQPPHLQQHFQQQQEHKQGGNIQQLSNHDGMPDFCMMESFATMNSNVATAMDRSSHHQQQHHQQQYHQQQQQQQQQRSMMEPPSRAGQPKFVVETAKVVDKSSNNNNNEGIRILPDALGSGSTHSIMSGLSRISDTSGMDGMSIFSHLSSKIGNVSTRSIAMSDISAIDLQERVTGDDDDTDSDVSDLDPNLAEVIADHRKRTTMNYDP